MPKQLTRIAMILILEGTQQSCAVHDFSLLCFDERAVVIRLSVDVLEEMLLVEVG